MFDLATQGLAQNSGRITNEGFITFDGEEELRFISRLVNHGTIDQVAGQNVQLRNFSTTVNHGDWRIHGDSTIELIQFSGLEAKWYNFGLIEKLGSGSTRIFANGSAPTLSNSGHVAVREGTLEIDARSIAQLDQSNQTLSGGRWTVGETSTLKFFDSEELDQPIASNFGNITFEAGDSTFASIDSLSSNGGVLDLRGDRQFSIAGDFVNGIDHSRLTLQSVRTAFSGRLVGLAVDPATGDVIAHSRNQRNGNNEPYFDRIDQNGVAVGEVIHQPGGPVNVSGIDLITTEMTIGQTTVPAGSLIFIHANETPATLYAIDVDSGLTLASVDLTDVTVDQSGVAHHPARGTVFVIGKDETIREVDPTNGLTVNSFSTRPDGQPFFRVDWGGIDVLEPSGELVIVGSGQSFLRVLTATGDFVEDISLASTGVQTSSLSDIAIDNESGQIWISNESGGIFGLSHIVSGVFGSLRLDSGVDVDIDGEFRSLGDLQFSIAGPPGSGPFASVDATGAGTIGGSLQVHLSSLTATESGDAYRLIRADMLSGQFDTIIAPDFETLAEDDAVLCFRRSSTHH